jgi:hypothetical protein
MNWNYRVVKYVTTIPLGDRDITYAIHSAYYDENNDIVKISERPQYPMSDDLEGLKWTLSKMMEACNKPAIDYNTIEELN